MADDDKSKLQIFRERLAGSAGRVAANPVAGAMASNMAFSNYGPLGDMALKLGQSQLPASAHGPKAAPAPVVDIPANLEPRQVTAPFPFAAGGGDTTPAVAPLPAPGIPQRGGGVGGGVNPFAGLRAQLNDARTEVMSGMDQDAELQRDMGDAKATKMAKMADLQQQQAADMVIDARAQQQADYDAQQKHKAFIERNEQLANEIGEQKIDPNRVMRNKDSAEKVTFVLGAVLGGALRGLDGGRNDTLDRLDKEIDRDISVQQDAINNKKASLAARQSLFGQMLQETGDSRVAAMQTRNLMYEAMKQDLMANAERLGIPEVKVNAEIGVRAIQARQDALREQLAATQLQSAQQQAAAAASARASAEKEAWARSMQMAELGLKKDAQAIELAKLNKGDKDEVGKEVASLGKDLADPKLAAGRAPIEALKAQLAQTPEGEGLAGIGSWAEAKRGLASVATFGLAGDKLAFNDQEKINRGNWEKLKLAYQSQITGSGASNEERKMISAAFEGAKTPAEQRAAIATADALFKQQEERRLAGASPEAVAIFKQRLAAQGKK